MVNEIRAFEEHKDARNADLYWLKERNAQLTWAKSALEVEETKELKEQEDKLQDEFEQQQREAQVKAKAEAEGNISEIVNQIQEQNVNLNK